MADASMLAVRGVTTFYGAIQALHGVDLDVANGEIVTLIGANGAGKSTLLMTICGNPRARSGSIQLEGEEGAVLELVNVEDLTVSVSARHDANHAGNSTPGRFLCLKLRVNNRSPVLRKEERGQVLSGQGSTYFPKPAVRPAAAWSGRVAMTNELITLAGQTARGSFAG